MNKAKILLTAIVVLTVLGAALAFKAKQFGYIIYTPDENGICSVPYLNHYTTDDPSAPGAVFESACIPCGGGSTTTCEMTYVIPQP
jgi:hypothetical protein